MIFLLETFVAKIKSAFPTYLVSGRLAKAVGFNRELKCEIAALEQIDEHGRAWSAKHYHSGYSSYSSLDRLQTTSPNFAQLEKKLRPYLRSFVRRLNWDLNGRAIEMTTCWVNRMGVGCYHTMHNHPSSVISGVYYVEMPAKASALKFEDPRLNLFMAAPPRANSAPASEQPYLQFPAKAGEFILFESWMRHEVPPHRGTLDRLSVSFNYEVV